MSRKKGLAVVSMIFVAAVALLATGCQNDTQKALEAPPGLPKNDTVSVFVYWPVGGGELVKESKVVEKSSNMPKTVVQELFKRQPGSKQILPILPNAKVLDVTVKDGLATVNFDRKILDFQGSQKNQVGALAAIVSTLTQFSEVKQVQFQIEGKTQGTIGGKDIQAFWGDVTLKDQPWKG
ncbi:MAG: GerMN domain-containing protein [Chloroflexi bacterium]|nr:GerMN domain-containing protein [Chloroflexota bacterium]